MIIKISQSLRSFEMTRLILKSSTSTYLQKFVICHFDRREKSI